MVRSANWPNTQSAWGRRFVLTVLGTGIVGNPCRDKQNTHQCQLFTFVASARSSTIHRGSPSPHLAIVSLYDCEGGGLSFALERVLSPFWTRRENSRINTKQPEQEMPHIDGYTAWPARLRMYPCLTDTKLVCSVKQSIRRNIFTGMRKNGQQNSLFVPCWSAVPMYVIGFL